MFYTCFLIGDGTLLIECTTILSEKGFRIKGVISHDSQVRSHCDKAALRSIDLSPDLATVLAEEPFDFLFSIVNSYILPVEILRLPLQGTINYHDGPLPAYAGVHATFWALVNDEKTHGITWHLVDEGIDTGAILKQSTFPIDPEETSISLNIKCYSVAVEAFRALTDELLTNTLVILPQSVVNRSYYGQKKRPDLLVNWSKSALNTARLHRALDFGFYPSPFGYLKIWVANRFVLVKQITLTATPSRQPPGTVEAILTDKWLVATADFLLAISGFHTLDGEPVSIVSFCEQTGLTEGQVLMQPGSSLAEAVTQADAQCFPHQAYWVDKLVQFQPTILPWAAALETVTGKASNMERINVQLNLPLEAAWKTNKEPDDQMNLVLTALLITLARLANQPAVRVGYQTVQSAQMATDTAGLMIECLPFRVDFNWESGFAETTERVRQEQVMMEEHRTFVRESFVSQPVLRPVAPEFRQNGFPLIIDRSSQEANRVAAGKELRILLTDEGEGQVVFNPAIWSSHWVADVVSRWMLLLENAVAQPLLPLKAIPLLTPEEQHRILVDWNATATPYPREHTVHQLVEAQVHQRPLAEALRCGDFTLTYEQLNQQANQLAWCLTEQGVVAETLVGICLERSPEMIISVLAILKAGGAYVPLDPAYPAIRLSELVGQTGVDFIITQQKWLDRLPSVRTYIVLDEDGPHIAQQPVQNLDITMQAEQLAYVLFTSGSTGRPKGAAIPHRSVVRTVRNDTFMRLDERVRMLIISPLSFDASTVEIWGALVNGGCIVILAESPPSLETIKQTIQTYKVNTAFFTTSLFNVLVDSDISELITLTQMSFGGEVASSEHARRARRQLPNCQLNNGYGPTESTTFSTFYLVSANEWGAGTVPIGRPLNNTQIYIVDSFLNPMPVGVPGELLIGGDGLAREYLGQPELTNQKFISDPFSGQPGSRLYRTGDQALYLADGTILFLGRQDDQVKIRGFRIEPGEIEQALCQHSTVGAALVLAVGETSTTKRLVAYVVPKPGETIEPRTLRIFLRASLPDYLIPNAVVPLDAMPLATMGKVDKSRLPLAFPNSQPNQSDGLTSTEVAMKPLWAAVLNQSEFSAGDNFFELGGSSLMAIQLITHIFRQFGLHLSMNDVFKHPTLCQLSAHVDQAPRSAVSLMPASSLSAVIRSDAHRPLSLAQRRLWIFERLYGSLGVYNVPVVLRIRGDLNQLALQQSLTEISRRHEILRATFGHSNGVPFQQIGPSVSWSISVHDLVQDTSQTLIQWLTAEAYRPFDLTRGPLVRASLARQEEPSWLLALVFHHIIYDGWSTKVLATELSSLYASFSQNRPISLPPLPIQYTDCAQWQIDHLRPETLQRERIYWKNHLANVPPLLTIPTDKPRPATQSFTGADYAFRLPQPLCQQLRSGELDVGTTTFLRLLTVFAVWLQQTAKTNDVVIGFPVAGRSRPEFTPLIGFFVNTLVLRVDVTGTITFRQLLRNVRQLVLDAYDNQSLSFEQVVEEVRPPRTLAYSPLVQVAFDFQEDTAGHWVLDELLVEEVCFEQQMAKFDLNLSCRETSGGIDATVNYRTDLFYESTVAQMARTFLEVLEQLVNQPDQPIANLFGPNQVPVSVGPSTASRNRNMDAVPEQTLELTQPGFDHTLAGIFQLIWSRLLEIPAIGWDDDFFELGGHSLLVVQMTAVIQEQTAYSLPVTSVFANPTIRTLTTYLKTTQADVRWQSLVPVNPLKQQGDRRAVYLVHPLSGDVSYVYQLAAHLGNEQPIYGLRAVGLDGITAPLTTLEEIAAYYVQLIAAHQPAGPLSLGGYSLGGVIAFEMARQLTHIGREVDVVMLIDAYPINPNADNHTQFPIRQLLRHYYYYWRSLPKQPSILWPVLQQKMPWVSQYLFGRFVQALNKKEISAAEVPTLTGVAEPESQLTRSLRQAYSQYTFNPYDGKVVFLRIAKDDPFATRLNKVDFGWGRYACRGVEVHQLIGHHETIFSQPPLVEQMASILQAYLSPALVTTAEAGQISNSSL